MIHKYGPRSTLQFASSQHSLLFVTSTTHVFNIFKDLKMCLGMFAGVKRDIILFSQLELGPCTHLRVNKCVGQAGLYKFQSTFKDGAPLQFCRVL